MGKKKPITVGSHFFPKQGDAMEYFRSILWRYGVGDRISDADAPDVLALLSLHLHAADKIGCGISHFEIALSEHGSRCFGVVRTDGSKIGFSYRRCINQKWDE